ncbi:MAG: formyltransferase, partial [Kiritimatiellae bacterium]|nr:formyltransferase [Kiritimatiellia bacterium]
MKKTPPAVVFAYHNMGVIGLDALMRHGVDVKMVFTYRDDPGERCWFASVADWCGRQRIPCDRDAAVNSPAFVELVRACEPDFLFSFYYRDVLSAEVLQCARHAAINLHGSLLPKYRGRAPVNWAIINGEKETGVTLHHMTVRPDAGHIIGQRAVAVDEQDTASDVYMKLERAADLLLDEMLPMILRRKAPGIPQNEDEATVCCRRRPEDGLINWHDSARRIFNLIRAVTEPYPGAFTWLLGDKLIIWRARPEVESFGLAPGELGAADRQIRIGTMAGSLLIEKAEYRGRMLAGSDLTDALLPFAGS